MSTPTLAARIIAHLATSTDTDVEPEHVLDRLGITGATALDTYEGTPGPCSYREHTIWDLGDGSLVRMSVARALPDTGHDCDLDLQAAVVRARRRTQVVTDYPDHDAPDPDATSRPNLNPVIGRPSHTLTPDTPLPLTPGKSGDLEAATTALATVCLQQRVIAGVHDVLPAFTEDGGPLPISNLVARAAVATVLDRVAADLDVITRTHATSGTTYTAADARRFVADLAQHYRPRH